MSTVRPSSVDGVARSIGRELNAVKKSVHGLESWRDGVQEHMDSVSKKLDMLLNVMLPTGQKAATLPSRVGEPSNLVLNPEDPLRNASNMGDSDHCTTPVYRATLRTGCGSGVSEVMCTQNPSVMTEGMLYFNSLWIV